MARIAGVNIPTGKRVVIALQYIHGIGQRYAGEICEKVGIPAERRVNQLTDADVLRCAKKPWEDAFSKERTSSGWQKEGIFPKFNCALYWRLRVEESKKGELSARPPVQPDENWLRQFDAPHSSAARISGDPKTLDEEVIEAEVERRVAARIAGAEAPEKLPGGVRGAGP